MASLIFLAVAILILLIAPMLGVHHLFMGNKSKEEFTFGAKKGLGKKRSSRKIRGVRRSLNAS